MLVGRGIGRGRWQRGSWRLWSIKAEFEERGIGRCESIGIDSGHDACRVATSTLS